MHSLKKIFHGYRSKGHPYYYIYVKALNAWHACNSPNNPAWEYCGKKGIKFMFGSLKDMVDYIVKEPGLRILVFRKDLVLNRVDKNGNYQPGNLRAATRSEHIRNRMPRKSKKYVC